MFNVGDTVKYIGTEGGGRWGTVLWVVYGTGMVFDGVQWYLIRSSLGTTHVPGTDLVLVLLCALDSDCPAGYMCVDGNCVLAPTTGFPWSAVLFGLLGIVLLKGWGRKKRK